MAERECCRSSASHGLSIRLAVVRLEFGRKAVRTEDTCESRANGSAGGDEAIAQAPLGLDVKRVVGIVAELIAQAADVDTHVVGLIHVVAAPHLGQQRAVLE